MLRHQAIAAVEAAPLDPEAHEQLGDAWRETGGHRQALACYRGAAFLGAGHPGLAAKLALVLVQLGRPAEAMELLDAVAAADADDAAALAELRDIAGRTAPVELSSLDPNRYLRMHSLADAIGALPGLESGGSVVDVGGGDGSLALFLPGHAYLLVEPGTNGLSGLDLPLPDGSADVVCACHVLEHIPPHGRDAFLDQLVRVARRHVLLLNPFAAEGVDHEARLQLAVDLTGAGWAREHLECGLPGLDVVRDYAARRGLAVDVRPHGAVAAAFSITMMNHFARLAGRAEEAARVCAWLNTLDEDHLTSPGLPAAWLVHLHKETA